MALTLKSVTQFISDLQSGIISALSGNAPNRRVSNFSTGSVANAFTESAGTQLAFVQSQAPAVLAITRAATCTLPDLITFVADYYLSPTWNGPTYNHGSAVFTRNQASGQNQVLLTGSIIQTATPSPASAVQYQVIGDVTNSAYSVNAGGVGIPGYTLTAGLTQFAQAPLVQAINPGSASAAKAGTLIVRASPSIPFDSVTNPSDINNGNDGESASALRTRFADYIGGLSSGTRFRIAAVVAGVQAGLSFTINEYTFTDQTTREGFTTIPVDDGSGAISGGLLTTINSAITDPNLGKSLGSQVVAIAPSNVAITVVVSGTTIATGFVPGDVRAAIQAAIIAYVNGNGVGGAPTGTGSGAPSLKLLFVGVANVVGSFVGTATGQGLSSYSSITVNGGTIDIPLNAFQLARTSSGAVTVT